MKNVLMVASVPAMIGNFNMNNIAILQKMGYEVCIGCNFNDTSVWPQERTNAFIEQLKELDIECHQIDFSRKPNFRGMIRAFKQLERLVLKKEISFVHCHTPLASAITRMVCHKYHIKVIYTAHGFHFYEGAPFLNWLLYYPVEKMLSRWTDVLITINREDYSRAKSKFHAINTEYVPGVGVDTKKYVPMPPDCGKIIEEKRREIGVPLSAKMLLSVGELSARKNHRIVIEMLQKAPENYWYVIVGKGELKDSLLSLDKTGRVKLLGYRSDIRELLYAADLFVFPSVQEGLPVALMEAMACGKVCCASRIRGNVDLIHDLLFDYLKPLQF